MKSLRSAAFGVVFLLGTGVAAAAAFGDYSAELTPLLQVDLGNLATPTGTEIAASFADVTVTFLGHSAAFSNTILDFGGTALFNNNASNLGDTALVSGLIVGNPILFQLRVDQNGNGVVDAEDYTLASGTSFSKLLSLGGGQYILGFEDTRMPGLMGGFEPGGDLDYTDMTFKLAVPEPSIYALMFAGLGVMAFVARRRRNRL